MKDTITLDHGHHIAIRVALMQHIRTQFGIRRLLNNRESITDAISALRLVRNSDKLESTPYSFKK
jgi:hypothetical protein